VTGAEFPDWAGAVVLLRDHSYKWVGIIAEAVRASGRRPVLVTGPIDDTQWRLMTPLVDDVAVTADPYDAAGVAATIRQRSTGGPVAGLVTLSDAVISVAARAAELLGLRRAPASALALARNKYGARVAMRDAGLPVPRFALLHQAGQATAVAAEVGLPAVLKPVNGTASHSVRLVRTVEELAEGYAALAEAVPRAALGGLYRGDVDGIDPTRSFLVESALQGKEYCLDVIVRDGEVEPVALIEKFLIDERFFERGFVWPPFELPQRTRERMIEAADGVVRALGLDDTVAHVELIDDATAGPVVVEVNAGRPGGQMLGTLILLTTGVDMGAELVALCQGAPRPVRDAAKLPIPLATLTIFGHGNGRLLRVEGLDEVADMPDVIAMMPLVHPGDLLTDEYEIFAVNVLVGYFADRTELTSTYAELDSLVRLVLEPADAC